MKTRKVFIKKNGEYSNVGLNIVEKVNLFSAKKLYGGDGNINPLLENGEILFLPDYKINRTDSKLSGIEIIFN